MSGNLLTVHGWPGLAWIAVMASPITESATGAQQKISSPRSLTLRSSPDMPRALIVLTRSNVWTTKEQAPRPPGFWAREFLEAYGSFAMTFSINDAPSAVAALMGLHPYGKLALVSSEQEPISNRERSRQ